ncbi:hypothetical protein SISSUDRAFT_637228 [Sistotremastrum suecicum HHB10207 ss-3]|uniref:Uncharacterized protein n=1 Tax=Sistotremastrum suecicum HHB10207 ss-3 TaxID=1314776 RepID=A0A165X7U0_9AGAM|nr:hypothetical protein SISSUDRAFT_637228 [Sistotremastrum suecicum HHB10207 ss-3]
MPWIVFLEILEDFRYSLLYKRPTGRDAGSGKDELRRGYLIHRCFTCYKETAVLFCGALNVLLRPSRAQSGKGYSSVCVGTFHNAWYARRFRVSIFLRDGGLERGHCLPEIHPPEIQQLRLLVKILLVKRIMLRRRSQNPRVSFSTLHACLVACRKSTSRSSSATTRIDEDVRKKEGEPWPSGESGVGITEANLENFCNVKFRSPSLLPLYHRQHPRDFYRGISLLAEM